MQRMAQVGLLASALVAVPSETQAQPNHKEISMILAGCLLNPMIGAHSEICKTIEISSFKMGQRPAQGIATHIQEIPFLRTYYYLDGAVNGVPFKNIWFGFPETEGKNWADSIEKGFKVKLVEERGA